MERAVAVASELPEEALLFMNLSSLTLDISGDDEDWLLQAVRADLNPSAALALVPS